jgi:hypothetical protein
MTILEAIQSTVSGYPLPVNTFNRVLTDRGLSGADTYSGTSRAFELATADIYKVLATAANISEGGFSVSINDRKTFLAMANSIYSQYGVSATGNTISDATERW